MLRNPSGRRNSYAASALILALTVAALPPTAAIGGPRVAIHAKAKVKRVAIPSQPSARLARPPAAVQDNYARTLLRQMLQAEQHVVLQGSQTTVLNRNGRSVTSEQQVLRNGSHAFRLEYTQPARLAGQLIIDNGRAFWHYSPASKRLEVGPSRVRRLRDRVPQVMRQIKQGVLAARYIGRDTVAGRPCAVVEISSGDLAKAPSRRFWIDVANGAQLRIDEFGDRGQLISSSYYTTVTYNPTIPKDAFKPPATPKDTHLASPPMSGPSLTVAQAQAQAGFAIQQPTYLPAGFQFQTASVSDFQKQKLVALRYANGLNVLSLFETKTGARADAPPRLLRPRRGVFVLAQSGLRLILVGNLIQSEMEKVVISVR